MSNVKRKVGELHAVILAAAKDGRGLYLSKAEVAFLSRQPFVSIDPAILELEWRPVPGYERYEVSEHGHVRRAMKLLKATEADSLHSNVTLYNDAGKQWRVGVHHLVALTFWGPAPEGKPFACHRNGRPWENQRENIYWGSREENTADMVRHASLKRGGESAEWHNAMTYILEKSNG